MKKIFEEIRGKIGLIEEMYDFIRIVDPVNKSSIIIKTNEIKKNNGICYDFWERESACSNCISMRAYNKKDTFIKIEYISNKIFLMTATPLLVDGKIYILEMLKDISENGRIFSTKNSYNLDMYTMINEVNDKFIIDEASGVYNRQYIDERLPVDINNCNTHGYELSVIKISIDYLKAIAYKYGEEIKNKIIRDFIKLVRNLIISNSDWIGRYNTDSFFIVLNSTDKEHAMNFTGKINNLVNEFAFKYNDINIKISLSTKIYCVKDENIDVEKILEDINNKFNLHNEKYENSGISEHNINKNDDKLHLLNCRINELREILNEVCVTSEKKVNCEKALEISQYLDELIVEYMLKMKNA